MSHDEVLHAKSDDPRSPYDGTVLCVLSPAGEGDKAQGDGLGGSSGKANELDAWSIVLYAQGELESSKTSEFDESIMFDVEEMMRVPVAVAKWRRIDQRHAHEPLLLFTVWRLLDKQRGEQYRASSPLSVEARRGLTRLRPQEKKARRDSKKRSVEGLRKCEEVQERRSPEPTFPDVAKASAEGRNGRSKKHQGNPPIPALNPHRSLASPVFLEIFSGCGHLASSVARYTGWPVSLWDISLGAEYDLRSPSKRRMIRNWVRTGLVRAFHLGTPCESFSRARDVPPGPPPLRSNEFPFG